jgi:hypothetical protein
MNLSCVPEAHVTCCLPPQLHMPEDLTEADSVAKKTNRLHVPATQALTPTGMLSCTTAILSPSSGRAPSRSLAPPDAGRAPSRPGPPQESSETR